MSIEPDFDRWLTPEERAQEIAADLGESMRDGTYWTEDDYDYFATVAENAITRNHERVQDALERGAS